VINNPAYEPVVVFPHEYASEVQRIDKPPVAGDKKLLFIFLDGTWREAKKMFSKSDYLSTLPVLGVNFAGASDYLLRESSHIFQHCTAEVGVHILAMAEEKEGAERLAQYFSVFRREYVKGKPHLREKLDFASAQVK
jgi:DTW domain-containing protein YfiP